MAGTVVCGGAANGSVYVWDAATHRPLRELRAHSDRVRALCACGDNQFASGSGSADGSIVLWDIRALLPLGA